MQIQVKRFRDILDLLAPVLPRKPTLTSIGYICLGDGRAVATDLEIMVAYALPEVEEAMLLPGKDALEFLKYVPGGSTVEVTADEGKVTLSTGFVEASFSELPSIDEFPPLPVVEGEHHGVISGDVLVHTLVEMSACAAVENTRPVLNGVNLAPGEEIEAAGADGFRLAWKRIPGRLSGPPMVIPLGAVKALDHLWKKAATPDLTNAVSIASLAIAPRLLRMQWGGKYLKLNFDSITIIVQLTHGTFPNYRQLIPEGTHSPLIVDAETMLRALAQVATAAKDGSGAVRLHWEGEGLKISAKGSGSEVTVPISARFTDPGFTALNIRYLREYLKGKSGLVSLQTADPKSPVLFTHKGLANFVVMPMFVDQGDKGKAKVKEPVDEAAAAEQEEIDKEAEEAEIPGAGIDPAAAPEAAADEAEVEASAEPIKPAKKKREKVKK